MSFVFVIFFVPSAQQDTGRLLMNAGSRSQDQSCSCNGNRDSVDKVGGKGLGGPCNQTFMHMHVHNRRRLGCGTVLLLARGQVLLV
ncbi:hypothetical protein BDR07DRAFT_1390381 [Suillus spraguei]|nr:hypothetical protein BDR07DRAFT_1390381 [Suillus spraguei]